jgi:Flp pilus assembly pilin Flp
MKFTTAALRALELLSGIRARFEDDDGQTLAEYGLIVTTIAVGVVILAGILFRGALIGSFNSASSCLNGSC